MPGDHTDTFRIGVTRDVRRLDGSFVFAPYDLSALEVDGIRWEFLDGDARPLLPSQLQGFDGLYHFSAPLDAGSLDGVDRLATSPGMASASISSTSRRARSGESR